MNITNKDAKIIYSKYWYKHLGVEPFPTIYIDEYWDYTIDMFNLRKDWEIFLDKFNKEFSSAKQYIDEYNSVLDRLYEKLFISNASQKINDFKFEEPKFKKIYASDCPDGDYWHIDLHSAFNQCLNIIDVFKPGVTYESAINEITDSDLLRNSKFLRIKLYDKFDINGTNILYNICERLLYKLLNTPEFQKININDVIGIHGDALFISKDNVTLKEGDYIVDDISFCIDTYTVKSVTYKNKLIKYLVNDNASKFFFNGSKVTSIDEQLCIMKAIKNQQPNQMDLTVGYEDQIFFIMDY